MADQPSTTPVPTSSAEVVKFDGTKSNYPILFDSGEVGGLAQVLEDNFGDEGFRASDLDRIKIPAAAGRFWDIPDERPTEKIEGVVVHKQKTRSYWVKSLDEQKEGEQGPPDCASDDGAVGDGMFGVGSEPNPTGDCSLCPMNEYGSAKNNSKACKEQMQLFLLQQGSILPMQVTLPATSLAGWRKYMTRLAAKGIGHYAVTTRLGLAQDKSSTGIAYSYVVPEKGDDLHPAEAAAARQYGITIRGTFALANEARREARAAQIAELADGK